MLNPNIQRLVTLEESEFGSLSVGNKCLEESSSCTQSIVGERNLAVVNKETVDEDMESSKGSELLNHRKSESMSEHQSFRNSDSALASILETESPDLKVSSPRNLKWSRWTEKASERRNYLKAPEHHWGDEDDHWGDKDDHSSPSSDILHGKVTPLSDKLTPPPKPNHSYNKTGNIRQEIDSLRARCTLPHLLPFSTDTELMSSAAKYAIGYDGYSSLMGLQRTMFKEFKKIRSYWCLADGSRSVSTKYSGKTLRINIQLGPRENVYRAHLFRGSSELVAFQFPDERGSALAYRKGDMGCHHSENDRFRMTFCKKDNSVGIASIQYNHDQGGYVFFKGSKTYYMLISGTGKKITFTSAIREKNRLSWVSYNTRNRIIHRFFLEGHTMKHIVKQMRTHVKDIMRISLMAAEYIHASRMNNLADTYQKYINRNTWLVSTLDPTIGFLNVIQGNADFPGFGLTTFAYGNTAFDPDVLSLERNINNLVYSPQVPNLSYRLCFKCDRLDTTLQRSHAYLRSESISTLRVNIKSFPDLYWSRKSDIKEFTNIEDVEIYLKTNTTDSKQMYLDIDPRLLSVIDSPTISDFSYSASPNVDTLSYRDSVALSYNVSHSSIFQLEPSVMFLMMTLILVLPIWPIKLFRSYKYKETKIN